MPGTDFDQEIDILLVEDNPADVRLTQEAFKETRLRCKLHVARDGAEALDFLRQNGRFTGAPRPNVILLDLNLPKKDGREVLAEVKNEPLLKSIPSSSSPPPMPKTTFATPTTTMPTASSPNLPAWMILWTW